MMTKVVCFIPGCTNSCMISVSKGTVNKSFFTFHRLPKRMKLLERLMAALDLPVSLITDMDNVMCSAHFIPLMEHGDLVRTLLDDIIEVKPGLLANSSAPRCAAAGCSMNLYSNVTLFKFPREGKRFEFWRMVAGTPPTQECSFLCARHFKRRSFLDSNREKLVEGAIPVYPTRPLHPIYLNYCPLRKPVVVQPDSVILPDSTNVFDIHDHHERPPKLKVEPRKKWNCAAENCDVSHLSHPNMRKINFPPDNERASLWREIVGRPRSIKYINSLCCRHFGINQFYDGESRKHFVKKTNPVYPTGPLNMNTMDYCPAELDVTIAMEEDGEDMSADGANLSPNLSAMITTGVTSTAEKHNIELVGHPTDDVQPARCSSVNCPVTSQTHPSIKLYDFPFQNSERTSIWMRIAGNTSFYPLRLCARHFDVNKRELVPKYPFWNLDPETQTYKPIFDPLYPKCCVPGCSIPEDDEGLNVSFHRFPLAKEIYNVWVQRIGWEQLELYDKGDVFRGFRVCSKHFSQRWFVFNESKEKVLRPGAIPSLFSVGSEQKSNSKGNEPRFQIEVMDVEDILNDSTCDVLISAVPHEDVSSAKRKSPDPHSSAPGSKKMKKSSENVQPESCISEGEESLLNTSEISFLTAALEEDGSSSYTREHLVDNSSESSVNTGVEERLGCEIFRSVADKSVQCHLPCQGWSDKTTNDGSISQENSERETDCVVSSQRSKNYRGAPSSNIIESAAKLFSFTAAKIDAFEDLQIKEKKALTVLEELLTEHLDNVISITGVAFVKKCFDLVVNSALKRCSDPFEFDGVKKPSDERRKFAVSLQTLSGRSYKAFSQITSLPLPSQVREWATNEIGYPGFNKNAFQILRDKADEVGDVSFLVSLSVAEIPIKRQVDWNGRELFGYVDLGNGRVKDDYIVEASSALVFHVNSLTHDFKIPIGYCLIRELSPHIRANLIIQYIKELYSVGVRCNAVVCDGSIMTYRTYKELGVLREKNNGICGSFQHPSNKSDHIFCFVDIDDVMSSVKKLLAEDRRFLHKDHLVHSSDIELIDDFIKWDLKSKVFPTSRSLNFKQTLKDLLVLQVQLKNDSRPFKRDGAPLLKIIREVYNRVASKSGGSIEFLNRMICIDKQFSSCNPFSKDLPGVRRSYATSAVGVIKSQALYLESLADSNDVKLLSGRRRIPLVCLHLNLSSLEGLIKRLYFFERKRKTNLIMTQPLTLRDTRKMLTQLTATCDISLTASQFKDAYYSLFCCNNLPLNLSANFTKKRTVENTSFSAHSPLHMGLYVSESYKYEPLSSTHERFDDFLTENAIYSWMENAKCSECTGLMMKAINEYHVGDVSIISDVHKMFKLTENCLSVCNEIPLNLGCNWFEKLANSVLNSMICLRGFKSHDHLFDSVEFGDVSHFTVLIKDLLRIFLRYRIGFMSTIGQVVFKSDIRSTFSKIAWV